MSDSYLEKPFVFKALKVLRYMRLYGPMRTLEKVRAQLHLKSVRGDLKDGWTNPKAGPAQGSRNVAIIGCGQFAYSTIAYYCHRARPGCIKYALDPEIGRAVSLISRFAGYRATPHFEEVLQDPEIERVFIASNHASHAAYAARALGVGKKVHIEKPHVVASSQLDMLLAAMNGKASDVFLGFNRPRSKHVAAIRRELAKEGGPLMINWFVAGHAIADDHWYFSPEEGGRILGNLCHWTDLTCHLVGLDRAFPCEVVSGARRLSPSDFQITFNFADGSVGSISFSAKGHTFEGVREYLNVHRGNLLVTMEDFHRTRFTRGARNWTLRTMYRDHGHAANIVNSLLAEQGETRQYVASSARLFLAAKEAVELGATVTVPPQS